MCDRLIEGVPDTIFQIFFFVHEPFLIILKKMKQRNYPIRDHCEMNTAIIFFFGQTVTAQAPCSFVLLADLHVPDRY